MSPHPRKRHSRSHSKHRAHSSVYSNLPAANINLGAMNVYAEVRGKYSRNANNTKNAVEVPKLVSRPTTSGSLRTYTRRSFASEEHKKDQQVEEQPKTSRPLNFESKGIVSNRRVRHRDLDRNSEIEKIKGAGDDKAKEKIEEEDEKNHVDFENLEGDKENGSQENSDDEHSKEEADRVTEVSFKTTSSQKKYIEELENLLKEERMKRIKAEDKLQRVTSSHSKKRS